VFGYYGEFRGNGKKIYVAGRRISSRLRITTGTEGTDVMPDRAGAFIAAIAAASLPTR
jgi:hypothetical protein